MADPGPTQAKRQRAVATPFGADVLLIKGFHATDSSVALRFELDLLSPDPALNADKILGENVTVRLDRVQGGQRFFNGFVARFVRAEALGRFARYRATLVPWFWFLTRTADCRIFQNQSVPDIIQQVLKDRGFSGDLDTSGLSGTYPKIEYCVQYRETEFNFLSRLMEQEGISYFFKHENGKHKLMLADSPSAHHAPPTPPNSP